VYICVWRHPLHTSNTEVLCLCGSSGTEAFFLAAQIRWVGHVVPWSTTGYPNRSSSDSCRQANAHSVVLIPTEWKLFGPMSILLSINN